jgi:predicted unusual protein kinase regulating ubiquinone biosynthesis (AarF/ABC1/UbiB family)
MIRARYRRIVWFFARLLTSLIYWELLLPRVGMRRLTMHTRPKRLKKAAVAYRSLAIQMGGVLIKVGQFLSSRVDVLPHEFTSELSGLQDEVPPVAFDDIRREIEAEFDAPLSTQFDWFETTPLAAASLGQVHRANLTPSSGSSLLLDPTGRKDNFCGEVVVKVLRPNIEQIIETDLAALKTVGRWLDRYGPIRKRADVPSILDEFSRVLYEEIDYLSEGRNAETFARNFKGFPGVRVPYVCWSHTTRRVLTLENVMAIKITDYEAISEAGVSRKEVASLLLDTYLKQIFEDGFFHADPHPGNLFVHPLGNAELYGTNRRPWELTFVDFGMTGKVPPNLRTGLRELLVGVGTRDAERVINAYQMMDMLLPSADVERLKTAEARVFDKYWGKNMTELTSVSYSEMKDLADEFRDLIYEMPFQVPQDIIFLARCVGILSGMCTGLDSQFNLWSHLAPFARKIIAEEAGSASETWIAEIEKLVRTLVSLPLKIDHTLSRLDRGEVSVRAPELSFQIRHLTRVNRGLTAAVIFSAFLLGSIQLHLASQELLAVISAGFSFITLLWILFNGRGKNGKD